ncbi:hypothetical protein ABRP29_24780, partial [Pseudomonas sp. WHRI 8822A]|uniref:hypothetical protein n=1 Tax=Pseudomonas sp. WHRI 8822A TaxID=3162568 RepID=UPI0032EE407F
GGAADQMIGHQPAQVAGLPRGGCESQRKRRMAIHHSRIAQWRDRIGRHVLPEATCFQLGARCMRQRDLASIEGRIGKVFARLLVDQRDR